MQSLVSVLLFCTSWALPCPLALLCPLSFKLAKVPTCLLCLPLAPGVLQPPLSCIGPGRVQSYCSSSPWPGLVGKGWWQKSGLRPEPLLCSGSPFFQFSSHEVWHIWSPPPSLAPGRNKCSPPSSSELPFTLSAFKELHCFFLACSFVEMDHLHCIALKISRPQQSESSPGNLLSYMAFNRNPWGGTVKNRIGFTPLKPGKPAEKLEQFQLLKTALC